MKILVDESPIKPCACPFATTKTYQDGDGRVCSLKSIYCTDTKQCPLFKEVAKMNTSKIVDNLEEVIAHLREEGDPHGDIPKLRAIIAEIQSE